MSEEAQSTLGMTLLMDGIFIGELIDPTLPDATAEVKETNSQNNSGGIGTSLVTWIKHGEMTFKVFYTGSTVQETLRTEIYDREMHVFTVIMPPTFHGGGHSFTFSGQFTKSAPVMNGSNPATIEFSVTCNSKPIPISVLAGGLTTTFFGIVDDDSPGNALTPVPAASTAGTNHDFTVEAYSDNVSVVITPVATTGTIRVNDAIVASGAASSAIPLNTGTGAITFVYITVTELNKTPQVYKLKFSLGPTAHP
jgi:hypothetical protein